MPSGFEKLVAEARKEISEISATEAAAKSKRGEAVIVDVREKDEWDEEHIPDATHMSRGTIELDIEEKVPDKNAMIVCHCGGGGRSALAAENLQKWVTKKCAPWPAALKRGKPRVYQQRNRRSRTPGRIFAQLPSVPSKVKRGGTQLRMKRLKAAT